MPFFGIFDQECLIWVFLGKNFKRTIVRFEISLIAKYPKMMKMSKFGTKSALFGYFLARTLKNYCYIWNQHLRISIIAKFCEETKMPKFGTKNALLSIFDQECLIWVCLGKNFFKKYCHIWNQHPQICLFGKFHEKTKLLKFGTKNAWFWYFWPRMPYLDIFGQEF